MILMELEHYLEWHEVLRQMHLKGRKDIDMHINEDGSGWFTFEYGDSIYKTYQDDPETDWAVIMIGTIPQYFYP